MIPVEGEELKGVEGKGGSLSETKTGRKNKRAGRRTEEAGSRKS